MKYLRLLGDKNVTRLISINRWIRLNLPIHSKQKLVLLSIVALSSLLFLSTLFTPDSELDSLARDITNDVNFGVVVDCGSSGTRAHVFKWFHNRTKNAIPRIEPLRDRLTGQALTKHITPGLSTLQDEPHKASDYMEPIMRFICDSVPSARHSDTPVYFMATAGLRLLEDNVQKEILADITDDLKEKFDFPKIKSQVITGEREGIYSWLSLNLNRIYNTSVDRSAEKSMGMIEMGGASVQVAFELTPEVERLVHTSLTEEDARNAYRDEQVTVKLIGDHYVKLFVTTFLGLGVNSARESAVDMLIRDHLTSIGELGRHRPAEEIPKYEMTLNDPCLPKKSKEVMLRPIEVTTSTSQHIGFVLKPQSEAFKVRLDGTGNFQECVNLLDRVMRAFKSSRLNCSPDKQTCPMTLLGENFIPFQHYEFAGLSEMFFTTNEMIHSAGQFVRSQVVRETKRICSTDYNDLIEIYSDSGLVKNRDRILHQCFRSSWLLTVLNDSGFAMPSDYRQFNTIEELDGREIDWTIGAFVSEVALR